jgi:crotonobetainyl-CoA:carnitine CoA-transferase CaiB-like acyl-CoA transferase
MVVASPAQGYRSTSIPGLATPIRFSRSATRVGRPAPRLGSADGNRGTWRPTAVDDSEEGG